MSQRAQADRLIPSVAYRAETEQRRGARPRANPADAFRLARGVFLAGERLDMSALAQELQVSRPTLYRWTGDRDQLLIDVLWSLSEQLLADARADAAGQGAEWLLRVTLGFMERVAAAEPLRRFLENDGAQALRVLTSRDSVHARLTGALEEMIVRRQRDDDWVAPLAPGILSEAIVRLAEAFIYNDEINHLEPDLTAARATIARLLGADPAALRR